MSLYKRCSKCKNPKAEFYPSSKYWCKQCQKDKMKEGYSSAYWKRRWARGTDKQRRIERARENYVRIFLYLVNHPCVDCREADILTLHFDHIGTDKQGNVSMHVGNGTSWTRIQKEIDKCEVVCANCHARRTHMRAFTYKYQYIKHGKIVVYKEQ